MPLACCVRLRLGCCLLLAALAWQVAAIDVWFGGAPFCSSSPNNCHIFDLEYVRNDARGSGYKCTTGHKVLCQTKSLRRELEDTPVSDLVVVSYNAFELPFSVSHNGQAERTCHIPRVLIDTFPDVDVVVFNEIFIGGCIQGNMADRTLTLRELMENYGFQHSSETAGESSRGFYNVNGGTVIVSRWPIVATNEMAFENYAGTDRFAEKGAIYVKVSKKGINYHVIGTHLQASEPYDKIREKQAAELSKFITGLKISRDEPVVIGGDFNADHLSKKQQVASLLEAMQADMPVIIGGAIATYDYSNNDLVDPKHTVREWLDYVVYSKVHKLPDKATIQVHRLKADTDVKFCAGALLQPYYVAPDAATCSKATVTRDLSDHFPVIARFSFNN